MAKLDQKERTAGFVHFDAWGCADSRALRNANDIVVVLTAEATVAEVSVAGPTRALGPFDDWTDKPIADCVTVESIPKLNRRLETLRKGGADAVETLEINHTGNGDTEFPIRYTLHRAEEGRIIMVGRDLRSVAEVQQQLVRAQLALEREYEKHRDFETRYRILRDNLGQAMLFVEAASGRVLDANETAAKLLKLSTESMVGNPVGSIFQRAGRESVIEVLARAASDPLADAIEMEGTRSRPTVLIRPILFRSAGETLILCRLEPLIKSAPATEDLLDSLSALYTQAADAFVFTDARGNILHANDGFLSLCDVVRASDLKTSTLADFLLRGIIDQRVLLENAASTGRVGMFATRLKSANGTEVAVEIGATHLGDRRDPTFGFVIRDRSRAEATAEVVDHGDAMQNAKELVGTAPLKELVAATADVVEKMCIETAVELTDNNRVAAAELLGLSRQSFYVRLRKYGMLKKGED